MSPQERGFPVYEFDDVDIDQLDVIRDTVSLPYDSVLFRQQFHEQVFSRIGLYLGRPRGRSLSYKPALTVGKTAEPHATKGPRDLTSPLKVAGARRRSASPTDPPEFTEAVLRARLGVFWQALTAPSQRFFASDDPMQFSRRDSFWSQLALGSHPLTLGAEQALLLERCYDMQEPRDVLAFLDKNPALVSLLLEAYWRLDTLFPNTSLELNVLWDPEAPGEQYASLIIRTPLQAREALTRLRSFEDEWWLDNMDRGGGHLCIDVAFA